LQHGSEALEFEDGSFPINLFTLSLPYQESYLALKEAHRGLTANGQLIITEPLANGGLTIFLRTKLKEF
jgi:hypothetical protein